VIQLENSRPIPFNIYIVPRLDMSEIANCSDHDFGTFPPVQVVSMKLTLESYFSLRTESVVDGGKVTHHDTFRFPLSKKIMSITILSLPRDVVSAIEHEMTPSEALPPSSSSPAAAYPSSADDTASVPPDSTAVGPGAGDTRLTEDNTDIARCPLNSEKTSANAPQERPTATDSVSLNLGAHFGLFLGSSTSISCGCLGSRHQIYPTFSTYNAYVTYRLAWKVRLVCAGKKKSVSGIGAVVVLAPSEQQERERVQV
jgi:hypothetical protein